MLVKKTALLTAFTTLCLTHASWADQAATDEMCQTEVKPYRVGARHIESKGVGYGQGYTTVEGFFSTPKSLDSCLVPFIDLRGHVFNNGKLAANAGLGLRLVNSRVWGINSYYDYRKTERYHYNQVSVGLESLGKLWDFRINGYLPVGKKESSLYHTKFHEFEGNHMILRSKREFAMKGLNAEAGAHFDLPKGMTCYVAAGPYYFEGEGKNAIGGEARVKVMLHKYVGAQVNGSYDSAFKGIIQGELRLTYPFGPKNHTVKKLRGSCPDTQILRTVAMQPVDRSEIIVTDRKHKYTTAINPDTNEPFFFIFVDNTSSSNGTFESPYHTLLAAEQNSKVNDIIYVFPGDGTDTGMDDTIFLKDAQRLLGSGMSHTFVTTLGSVQTPQLSTTFPTISNAGEFEDVITLDDDNEIAGFIINQLQSGKAGIIGADITNTSIHNNRIITSDDGEAITLLSSDQIGTITISDCELLGSDDSITTGVLLTNLQNGTFFLRNNVFSGVDSSVGLQEGMQLQQMSNCTVSIESNTFSSQSNTNAARAINLFSEVTASTVTIANNLIDMPDTLTNAEAGIGVTVDEPTSFVLNILNNTIKVPAVASLQGGIIAHGTVAAGPFCLNVSGNSITLPTGVPGSATGFLLSYLSPNTSCLTLKNNTTITPPGIFGYTLVEGGGSTFKVAINNNIGTFSESGLITRVSSCSGECNN